MTDIDLAGLRPLHLAVQPDIFPLAIGWWMMLIAFFIILLAIIAAVSYIFFATERQSLRALKQAYNQHASHTVLFAKEVSKLLKRVAIFKFGRDQTASLSGAAWAEFLMTSAPKTLTRAQADLIAGSTYMPPQKKKKMSAEDLNQAAQKWIKKVLRRKKSDR